NVRLVCVTNICCPQHSRVEILGLMAHRPPSPPAYGRTDQNFWTVGLSVERTRLFDIPFGKPSVFWDPLERAPLVL
ncbi:MAG: hypothetical protein ACK5PB_19295, partial [Pirellula sp.]